VRAADPRIGRLCDALAGPGYAVERDFLAKDAARALREALRLRDAAGAFHPAGIGVGAARAVRPEIRGDRICWLDAPEGAAESEVFAAFAALRAALNRDLMLGLTELELHYAIYPPGAGYQRHLDRSPHGVERTVTIVLYLNEGWGAADGGELVIATGRGEQVVVPEEGALVVFLSERFEHEVRAAGRERLSLTGWFSRRTLGAIPR
jgi:SM-20-related protein